MRERVHKCLQVHPVGRAQFDLQCVDQASPQSDLPARPAIVQVGSATGKPARRVDHDPVRSTDHTHQLPLRQYTPAAHTGPLGNMFYSMVRFFGHLISILSSSPQPHHPPGQGMEERRRGPDEAKSDPLFLAESVIAAFMFLVANDRTEFFIQY